MMVKMLSRRLTTARTLRAAAPRAHRALLSQQRNISLRDTARADAEYPHLVGHYQHGVNYLDSRPQEARANLIVCRLKQKIQKWSVATYPSNSKSN
jgi:hypothetical protein